MGMSQEQIAEVHQRREKLQSELAWCKYRLIHHAERLAGYLKPKDRTFWLECQQEAGKRHREITAELASMKPGHFLCGAKNRGGGPCHRVAVSGRRRCSLHGGLSSGPKSQEGRQRIASANRARAPRSTDRARVPS